MCSNYYYTQEHRLPLDPKTFPGQIFSLLFFTFPRNWGYHIRITREKSTYTYFLKKDDDPGMEAARQRQNCLLKFTIKTWYDSCDTI